LTQRPWFAHPLAELATGRRILSIRTIHPLYHRGGERIAAPVVEKPTLAILTPLTDRQARGGG